MYDSLKESLRGEILEPSDAREAADALDAQEEEIKRLREEIKQFQTSLEYKNLELERLNMAILRGGV